MIIITNPLNLTIGGMIVTKYKVVQEYTGVDSQIIEADSEEEAIDKAVSAEYCNEFVNEKIYEVELNVYEVKD